MSTQVPLPPADLRVKDLAGRRVGIWGVGREGLASLRALAAKAPGSSVVLAADSPIPDAVLAQANAAVADSDVKIAAALSSQEGIEALAACEFVIRSPGVPVRSDAADQIRAGGVLITTGTALWLAEREATDKPTVIGVSGTKGKSTTSSLIQHLFGQVGVNSRLAGNIGKALMDQLDPVPDVDVWVVELSSYQLVDLPQAPTVGVITNLLRDHIPWHGDEATYHQDKLRLVTAGGGVRMAVLSAIDPGLRAAGESLAAPVMWVDAPEGLHVADGQIREGERVLCSVSELPLRGIHNARNVCLALETVRSIGHEVADLAGALRSFQQLPHRQQIVAEKDGVTWVNDSIATTPEAAVAALQAFAPTPTVLIVGGDERQQEFDPLIEEIAHGETEIAGVVAIGETGDRLIEQLLQADPALAEIASLSRPKSPGSLGGTGQPSGAELMAAAVKSASGYATGKTLAGPQLPDRRPAAVLLSPAAPSHSVFGDFEKRGEAFAAAVAELDQ